jgi:AcrR family transcriptional regulator
METILKKSNDVVQNTKNHIINTARKFFSEYSYLGVSMDDIARKLKITKAALYYHFAGKAEIYQEVLDSVFNDLSSVLAKALDEPTVDKKLRKIIENYLEFGFKEKNLIKALMLKLSPADAKITRRITQLIEQSDNLIQPIIKEAFKNRDKKADVQLLTSLLTSMMNGLLLEYSFLNKKIDSKKVSNQIMAVILN